MSVKPIPEGYHSLTAHLTIKGADRAIDFYKKAFGAEELSRSVGPGGKIMHAAIKIGDSMMVVSDEFLEFGPTATRAAETLGGSPVTMHLYVPDVDAVFKKALEAGAKETMPVADQFWGDRYGRLADPFGNDWSIATRIKNMTQEEKDEAGKKFMAQAPAGH